MKSIFAALLPFLFVCGASAQLISHELIASYSVADIQQLMDDVGVPPGFVTPEYDVDIYKILYNSPYKTEDNLVQASGALFVPKNVPCPLPLASYQHGTQTKRDNVSSNLSGGQWEVSLVFASTGYCVVSPDYLGLGDSPDVPLHPYTHAFSQAHTVIYGMRAARQAAAALNAELNGQVFIYGYSQGGFATAAAVREIEANHAQEFQIAAAAPMSGPYDLEVVQVDIMISFDIYPTPGYLPYIVFSYKEMYPELLADYTVDSVFVPPYDTLLPPLFYDGETSIGNINEICDSVPRNMVHPDVMAAFENEPDHPLRQALSDNHLLDWAPQAPMKIYYCMGDEQVTYLNAENAYDAWTANGAPSLEKQDFGDLNHNDCAQLAFISGKYYFDQFKVCETSPTNNPADNAAPLAYPSPAKERVFFEGVDANDYLEILDGTGRRVHTQRGGQALDVSAWPAGVYFYRLSVDGGHSGGGRFLVGG